MKREARGPETDERRASWIMRDVRVIVLASVTAAITTYLVLLVIETLRWMRFAEKFG